MTFISTLLRALIGLAVLAGLYELYANAAQNPLFFPALSVAARKAMELAVTVDFQRHLIASAIALAAGLAPAVLIGIAVGLALAKGGALQGLFGPLVRALAGVPIAAFAPLVILWLGLGLQTKALLVGLFSVFPIMRAVMVVAAPAVAPRQAAQSADGAGSPAADRAGTAPAILSGLRWGLLLGVTGLLLGEIMGGNAGIGSFIVQSMQSLDTASTMAGVLTLAAPVTLAMVLLESIEAQLAA